MGAKAVVRDVGRVLNMGYNEVDRLAKLIPQKPGLDVTLKKAAEMEPDFAALAAQPEYKELMSYAQPRHACGGRPDRSRKTHGLLSAL